MEKKNDEKMRITEYSSKVDFEKKSELLEKKAYIIQNIKTMGLDSFISIYKLIYQL